MLQQRKGTKEQRKSTRRVLNAIGEFKYQISLYRTVSNAVFDLLESKEFMDLLEAGKNLVHKTSIAINSMERTLEQNPAFSKEVEVKICPNCGDDISYQRVNGTEAYDKTTGFIFCSHKCKEEYNS